ncbi:MAG TPA: hypothetical protein PLU17_06520 [Chitinophagaceae bacterium]|nr:hypothetical protein [Chitinophagaceae bacterium]
MYNKLSAHPVNWIDGMKINKNHFISTDHATIDSVRDIAQSFLTPYNYGLLPNDEMDPIQINISIDNQNLIKARLLSCHAITMGGARIHIDKKMIEQGFTINEATQATKAGEDGNYWISVSVNLFDRIPVGSPDPTENPPRLPFSLPSYQLHITPDNQLKQVLGNPNYLIVGKVKLNGAQSRVEDEYIPACTSVSSNEDLVAFHGELDSFFGKLELKCSQIVQKIFKKNQQNELSDLVMFLCDRMVIYLGSTITSFRWINLHQSPIHMIEQTVGLARVMKNTIDLRIGSGKEELLNYLSEWCELNQGELETLLTSTANIQYQHHDVNQHCIKIVQFVKVLGKLFETLGNLEFIGKKKDSNIFVKEESITNTVEDINKPKPKRRFFAD